MPDEKDFLDHDEIDETDFDDEFDEDFDTTPDDDLLAFERQLEADAGFDATHDPTNDETEIAGVPVDDEDF